MQARKRLKYIIGIFIAVSGNVFASGFYLPTSNSADLGTAFAGGAALAEDASTNYTNPAGLTRLKQQQIVLSTTGVASSFEFNGVATTPGLGAFFSQTGKAKTNFLGMVPAFHYARPISDRLTFGFSLTVPYGLGDKYPDTSPVRYDVTYAELGSLDIGPSLAYKINEKLSVGLGVDAMYFSEMENYMFRSQPLTNQDSLGQNEVNGWGYGWHGGLLYQVTPQTRLGLSYHSAINNNNLTGTSKFYVSGGDILPPAIIISNNVKSGIKLPSITNLSAYHKVTPAWAVMGNIEFMNWSILKSQTIVNSATPAGTATITIPFNYHDTWLYAIGTSYQFNDKWLLRTGVDYALTPTNNSTRDALFPHSDRIGVAFGGRYQAGKNVGLDAGYYHAFYRKAKLNFTSAATGNTLTGTNTTHVDLLGFQITWNIV